MDFFNIMIFVLNKSKDIMWKDEHSLRAAMWLCYQIDNSLDLGWNPHKIVLGTNFKFKYKNIESTILYKSECDYSAVMSKTYGIIELIDRKIINDNVWIHDLDAWQQYKFDFPKINGVGLTPYPGSDPNKNWAVNSGSYFFNSSARDIIEEAIKIGDKIRCKNDEGSWNKIIRDKKFGDRVGWVDSTYNMGGAKCSMYEVCEKPIKVLHSRWVDVYHNPQKCPIGKNIVSDRLYDLLYNKLKYTVQKNNTDDLKRRLDKLGAEYEHIFKE